MIDQLVEARHDDDIHILVDRSADHGAFMPAVVAAEIRTAAGKTDAQWRLRNDHDSSAARQAAA